MQKTTRPIFPAPASPITTARLLLRPIQPSDLADFHALRTQIEVMKWTTTAKTDADLEATQIWMDRFLPPNDATTFNFAVEELAVPGKVVGVLGCHIAEPPECGYMLKRECWGKGYATEAVTRWLQAWWELPRKEVVIGEGKTEGANAAGGEGADAITEVLKADIDERNVASARILEKCGFRKVSEEMVEENGSPIRIIALELQRPQ